MIRRRVTYQYISLSCIIISIKFSFRLRWGWPECQYWPLSIIPAVVAQYSWYSVEYMLEDATRQLAIPLTGLALGPRKYRHWLTSSHWPFSPLSNIQYPLIAFLERWSNSQNPQLLLPRGPPPPPPSPPLYVTKNHDLVFTQICSRGSIWYRYVLRCSAHSLQCLVVQGSEEADIQYWECTSCLSSNPTGGCYDEMTRIDYDGRWRSSMSG